MLNIPDTVKTLYKRDDVQKLIQIYFPNGERDRVANNLLLTDCVKLTESICSEEYLTFGLAENSVIEFDAVDLGDWTGAVINVFLEISLTSLSAAQIAAIEAGTWDGTVQTWGSSKYFRLQLGQFIVDSCPKNQKWPIKRHFKAFSLGRFDEPNTFEKTKLALPLFAEGYTYQPFVGPLVMSQLAYDNEKILIDQGWTRHNIGYAGGNSFTYTPLKFRVKNTSNQNLDLYFDNYTPNYTYAYNSDLQSIRAASYNKTNIRAWIARFDAYLETLNIDLTKPVKVANSVNVYVSSIAELRNLLSKQVQYYNGTKYAASGGPYNVLFPYVQYQGRTAADAGTMQYSYGDVDIEQGATGFIAWYDSGILTPNGQESVSYVYGNVYFTSAYRFKVDNVTAGTSTTRTDSVSGQTGGWSYTLPANYPLVNRRMKFDPNGSEIGVSSWTGAYDMRKMINDYLEIFAQFATPSRSGPMKIIRLDTSAVKESYTPELYQDFEIQAAHGNTIGKVLYIAKYNDTETGATYSFANGKGVYDMRENIILPNIGMTAAEIETLLKNQFVPYVQNVDPAVIDMAAKGLPYVECGDYVKVVSVTEAESLTFITRREHTGIQALFDSLESAGNKSS